MCRAETSGSGQNRARAEACKIMWVTLLKDTAVQELFFRPMHHKCTAYPKTFFPPVLYHPQMKIEKLVSVIHSSSCASLSILQAKKSSGTSQREPHPFSAGSRRQQQRTLPCR